VGQKISKIQKPIYDKKGKAKGRGPRKKKKDELNGLPNLATETAPIPPPALPPPNNSPGLKIRLVGKQKPLPHTTIAEKRKAAADALAAARAAADANALLLPDDANVSKKRKASEKRKPQPGDPPAPTLEPAPAIVKITKPKAMAKAKRPATPAPEPTPAKAIAKAKQSGPVVKITRAKAIAEGRPPTPAAPEVQTTSSKRGPGPDDQPNKKVKQEPSRKRGKPEAGTIPAEEQRKPQMVIESPNKAKTPDVIATVRSAVKAKALDDDRLSKFLAIGIPNA
jgi:hypothetical protein